MTFNNLAAAITACFGILAFVSPRSAAQMVGIEFVESRGKSEVRATYGGLFLGFGLFALFAQEPMVFKALGCGWLGAAMARVISIIVDRAFGRLNAAGVLLEGALGAMLIL